MDDLMKMRILRACWDSEGESRSRESVASVKVRSRLRRRGFTDYFFTEFSVCKFIPLLNVYRYNLLPTSPLPYSGVLLSPSNDISLLPAFFDDKLIMFWRSR